MLAADTLASYGSLAMFRSVERLAKVSETTAVAVSGDMSDWQHLHATLTSISIDEAQHADGHGLGPQNVFELLSRLFYSRRSQINPLWNSIIVAGVTDKPFLACVDLQGTTFHATTIATGFGAYLAQPILRKAVEGREQTLTESEAADILDNALRVLFYRDTRSINKVQRATITAAGVNITQPYSLKTDWAFAENIRGYGVPYE